MMKKRIVMAVLLLSLLGCGTVEKEQPESGDIIPPVHQEVVENPTEDTPVVTPDPVETPVETPADKPVETPAKPTDRMSYIRSVFAEYNYNAPSESTWIIKDEGPQKVAVIIKEQQGRGRPLMTKLIFLEGNQNEILFLEIENRIIINR